jgi:putative aldouronate transport system substrate-binding protein
MSEHETTGAVAPSTDTELAPQRGVPTVDRRTALRISFGAAGVAAFGGAVTRRVGAQATPDATPGATPGATPDASGRVASGVDGVPDAYTRLPAPFKAVDAPPASGGEVSTFQITFQPPVPGRDENSFWQELEKRLGVARLNAGLVPAASFGERLSAVTAGGDIPDLTVLFPDDAATNELLRQGAFTDLTPFLSGDALQEFPNLAAFPAYLWENVKVQGKIYGVPRETFRCGSVLAYRQDWQDKLGLGRPENADDLRTIFTAFTQGDPNGNGSADTWGLGAYSAASYSIFSRNFFDQVFRTPNGWRLNPDGTLTNAIETEEFARSVAYMRELLAAGVYHPDVTALTDTKQPFAAGVYGAYTDGPGALPGSAGLRGQAAEFSPGANVIGLLPPGFDGGPAVTHNGTGFYGMVGIPSRVESEERVRELLRILNFYCAPFGSEEWLFLNNGIEGVHWNYGPDGRPVKTELGEREVGGDLTYLTTPPTVFFYDRPEDAVFMQDMVKDHLAIGIDNPALNVFSQTAVEEGSELEQLQLDRLNAIITGREALDALPNYVSEWRERGGDRIREETQEGLASS